MNTPRYSRRDLISSAVKAGAAFGVLVALRCNSFQSINSASIRRFHLSTSNQPLTDFPEVLSRARQVGVTDVWLAVFLDGRWGNTHEDLRAAADRPEKE